MQSYQVRHKSERTFRVNVDVVDANGMTPVSIECLLPNRYMAHGQILTVGSHVDLLCERVFISGPEEGSVISGPSYQPTESGDAVLLHLSNDSYLFVGFTITQFEIPDDTITHFTVHAGPKDMPYPIATSAEYTYLLYEHVRIQTRNLANAPSGGADDPYAAYYDLRRRLVYAPNIPRSIITKYGRRVKTFDELACACAQYMEREHGWTFFYREFHNLFQRIQCSDAVKIIARDNKRQTAAKYSFKDWCDAY